MSIIASFKRADIGYGTHPVLRDVMLDVRTGEFLLIVGPNGAGKSALVKTLLGLIPPIRGSVKLFGRELGRFARWERVGYLPQSLRAFNPLFPATAEEIVSMGLIALRGRRIMHSAEDRRRAPPGAGRVVQAMERLGISGIRKEPIGSLSGGQLQRAFLARAIVNDPDLLILDEPNTALDTETREKFHAGLEEWNEKRKMTIIYITHDVSEIRSCATRLVYLDRRVVFHGSLVEFCRSDEMTERFGSQSQHYMCRQHAAGQK
jgi:zinc transport system ATP-binding protein